MPLDESLRATAEQVLLDRTARQVNEELEIKRLKEQASQAVSNSRPFIDCFEELKKLDENFYKKTAPHFDPKGFHYNLNHPDYRSSADHNKVPTIVIGYDDGGYPEWDIGEDDGCYETGNLNRPYMLVGLLSDGRYHVQKNHYRFKSDEDEYTVKDVFIDGNSPSKKSQTPPIDARQFAEIFTQWLAKAAPERATEFAPILQALEAQLPPPALPEATPPAKPNKGFWRFFGFSR